MVKTIAISCCGIGLGHAARDKAIFDKLRKKFSVKILSYGEGYSFLMKNKINTIKIPGISYAHGMYSFDIFSEVFEKVASFGKIRRNYIAFCKILDKIKPNLVITDLEPYAFLYAYRRNIPVIVLSNVIATLNNYDGLPERIKNNSLALQGFMLRQFVQFMLNRGTLFVEPSFDLNARKQSKVVQSDLVVRKLPAAVENGCHYKDFYYVSIGSQLERGLASKFKKILPEFKDKYFLIATSSAKRREMGENFVVMPFVKDPFPLIKNCSGIIAPAGHTIISEALVYGKPILAVPMKNHIEQVVNAYLVEKQGFGLACYDLKNLESSIGKFLLQNKRFERNISKAKFKANGAEQIAKIVSGLLKK